MSYLGRGLEQVDNISKLDNITFNGGTTYALTKDSAAFTPISSNAILISIDGVVQQGNFSVSGTNIVFNFSPTSSNTCNWILHMGTGVAFTPADSSITKDKTNFVSTSSAAGLQIKGDGTTDGTLQLNCSQNSHGVKIKSPSHGSAQSYTLTLPTTAPASNKIIQTDGSGNLSFIDTPSGNYVYLNKATSTGTANDITFDNFSSTYNIYKIFGHWHNSSSNTTARFRLRNSSGDITSSIYRSAVSRVLLTSSEGNINGSASEYDVAQFRLGNGGSTFDDHRQSVEITVFRPNEPDSCMVHFKNAFWSSDNNEWVRWEGAGWCNTQEAHTGIKFYQSSGTINDYYYVIYGLKDS